MSNTSYGQLGGLTGAISGALGQYNNGMSISPYAGQQSHGQWCYDQLARQYERAASMCDAEPAPKKKKPGRPIEQVQAEVDEWLKDQGI